MTVWVVVKQVDQGKIAGVFNTLQAASKYINDHPYDGYIIQEAVVKVDEAK